MPEEALWCCLVWGGGRTFALGFVSAGVVVERRPPRTAKGPPPSCPLSLPSGNQPGRPQRRHPWSGGAHAGSFGPAGHAPRLARASPGLGTPVRGPVCPSFAFSPPLSHALFPGTATSRDAHLLRRLAAEPRALAVRLIGRRLRHKLARARRLHGVRPCTGGGRKKGQEEVQRLRGPMILCCLGKSRVARQGGGQKSQSLDNVRALVRRVEVLSAAPLL